MNENRSLYRKVGYIVLIGILFIPLYMLGHPASIDAENNRTPGGTLAKFRDEHNLSQATLGEIDPTSQAIEVATLGLRGVAVQILWQSAQKYKMKEDWASCKATVLQITRLQPNFWSVWDFLGHDLAYNISVEFDDYRDRFYWVMDGINFLKDGVKYNATDPRFLAKVGWVYGNKIGRADEHVQYRRIFKKQQEEQGEKLTDNWLVSNDWYKQAEKLVESGIPLRVYIGEGQDNRRSKPGDKAPSPVLFFSEAPMALINYADTLEEEGTFDTAAKNAWQNAAESWEKYAHRDLTTAYGYTVRLSDEDEYRAEYDSLVKKLEALLPGEMKKLRDQKLAKLTPEERRIEEKDPATRTVEEINLVAEADIKAHVDWEEVAIGAPEKLRPEARRLAERIAELHQQATTISTYRDIVNYNYWLARCQSEPTEECLEARKLLYNAGKFYDNGELFEAKKTYEQAFEKWRKVLDDFPVLRENNIMADELVDEINKYKHAIGQTNTKFPEPFILQDMIDLNEGKKPGVGAKQSETPKDEKQKDDQPSDSAPDAKKPTEAAPGEA